MSNTVVIGTRSVWVTSITDRLDHAVDLDAMGVAWARGNPRALCGTTVLPAALSAPPGRRCPACATSLQHRRGTRSRSGRHARPGLWAWVRRTRRS